MVKVVGVRFKNAGKIYYFDPGDMEFSDGDKVVVETVRGLEFGEVVGGADMVPEDKITPPLRRLLERLLQRMRPESRRTEKKNGRPLK
jgi:cell fate regulator YaaT (PSP1 superfamily)